MKTPVAVPISGVLTLLVGLVSLCGGALRLIAPENGVAADVFTDVFSTPGLRGTFYFSMTIWIALAFLAVFAGGGLTAGWRPARRLAAIWAWAAIAADLGIAILYAVSVVPALNEAAVAGPDLAKLVLAGTAGGCCPTVWALALLAIVHNTTIVEWSRAKPAAAS